MNGFFYYVPFVIQNLFFVFFLPIYKIFTRFEVRGQENLKNLKGPIILAPNHTSELDPTAIPLIFPFLSPLLPIYSVIYPIERYKTADWKWRRHIYTRSFFSVLGGYPSYSGNRDYQKSLKDHISLLKKGRTVCIFPEGKCTIDGNINNAHGGLGFLAFETGAVIVPLVVNTFFGLTFRDFIMRRKKIILTILPVMTRGQIIKVANPTVQDFQNASQMVVEKLKENYQNSVESFVDLDNTINLEKPTFFRGLFHFFLIPILNNLPKSFKKKISQTHRGAKVVIDNATNHQALEVLYSQGRLFSAKNFMNKVFQNIWFHMDNSKAVRNRLKFVMRELRRHLESIARYDREINVISIASGSARAVIETVEAGEYLKEAKLSLTFLDKNPDAIEYSKKLSTKIQHLPLKMEWINDTVGGFFKSVPNKEFDIVEIVGLLDYFNDDKAVETFRSIYAILGNGGVVITANINHNREEKFVSNVIDWVMIYRSVEQLAKLLVKAGFKKKKMKVFYEPFKIHGIIVAKK